MIELTLDDCLSGRNSWAYSMELTMHLLLETLSILGCAVSLVD